MTDDYQVFQEDGWRLLKLPDDNGFIRKINWDLTIRFVAIREEETTGKLEFETGDGVYLSLHPDEIPDEIRTELGQFMK